MQSAFDIKFTFLDMSRSTIAGHLPHRALELRRAGTTTSAAQLQTYLQAAPVEQLPENRHFLEQSSVSTTLSPTIPSQTLAMKRIALRIIPCTKVTFVDGERTLIHKTCFVCPQNVTNI
jgi:hypothetical protein